MKGNIGPDFPIYKPLALTKASFIPDNSFTGIIILKA